MSGRIYLASAIVLGGVFIGYALAAVAPLLRRAGAQDLPLLDHPPDAAVRGAPGRPLPVAAAVVSPSRRRAVLGLAVAAVLAGLLTGSAAGARARRAFDFTDITGAEVRAQARPARRRCGKPRSLADLKGKVTVVFFGGIRNPRRCPIYDGRAGGDPHPARRRRRQAADRVRDDRPGARHARGPEGRPSPTSGRTWSACAAMPKQTAAAAREFKVFYAEGAGQGQASSTMDHSAASFVFDPAGRVRLFVPLRKRPQRCSPPTSLVYPFRPSCPAGEGVPPRSRRGAGRAPCASSSSRRPRSGGCAPR